MTKQFSSLTQEFARRELAFCKEKIDALLPRFPGCFPGASTEGLVYPAERENVEWTTSLFSGMRWLLYVEALFRLLYGGRTYWD